MVLPTNRLTKCRPSKWKITWFNYNGRKNVLLHRERTRCSEHWRKVGSETSFFDDLFHCSSYIQILDPSMGVSKRLGMDWARTAVQWH